MATKPKLTMLTSEKAKTRHEELGLTETDLMDLHYHLVLARALDERFWMLNRQGKTAFVISCAGHEGLQVGFAKAFQPGLDIFFPYYRDLALVLALGMTPREAMLGQLSREGDPSSNGRQMPSHFGLPRLNIVSVSSPVATQLTQAAGSAYASKLKNDGKVTYTAVGEGGTSKGDFHEALNFASVHKLPVIFLVENNGYAISVPVNKQMNITDISVRASSYGMFGESVDGTDVLEVYRAAKQAVERARRGEGPSLIEGKTYRYRPHSSSDDDRYYRTREEVEEWRNKDSIEKFEQYLREVGLLDEMKKKEVRLKARAAVDDAQEYAEKQPYPAPESALKYVYAEEGE
jgi:2-oxoisovalerate dehydrogenase E1 component alpha subunit